MVRAICRGCGRHEVVPAGAPLPHVCDHCGAPFFWYLRLPALRGLSDADLLRILRISPVGPSGATP